MDLKPTTIILLIDFEGHPALGDEFTNNQRYSTLAWLLNPVREKPLIIISNHNPETHKRTEEVAKMMKVENRHIWITIDPDNRNNPSIDSIKIEVEKLGYRINNVIIGGTNLAGCVLRSKPYSAIHWAAKGYKTQIFLPLCAEYQLPGVNQAERNSHATSIMYNVIRDLRLWDEIDIVRETKGLNIV